MWIAKPSFSLSPAERERWLRIESLVPLAQTLPWAQATEALGSKTFVIFSADELIGGIVFSIPHPQYQGQIQFECVNGPHLHWDNPKEISRQLATFAMAVSKLSSKFASLSLKPRWEVGKLAERLKTLPIAAYRQTSAATLAVTLLDSETAQFHCLHPRMRRTLTKTQKYGVSLQNKRADEQTLLEFTSQMRPFSHRKGFHIPPDPWFLALNGLSSTSNSSFDLRIITCETELSDTKLLVCIKGARAHYLFGYENRRSGLPACISTSAFAQWEALRFCLQSGIQTYDLNGFLIGASPDHPYYGVCRFKEQFSNQIIQYDVPEFLIG